MSFEYSNDFYMRLKFRKADSNGMYTTFLKQAITLSPGERVSVSLTQISFVNSKQYFNTKRLKFAVACPIMTGYRKAPPPALLSTEPDVNDINSDDDIAIQPRVAPKPEDVKFCEMAIDPAECSITSLINSVNLEISAKLDSRFKPNSCRIYWDQSIDRCQLMIDGSSTIPAKERFTFLSYGRLSKNLGFSATEQSLAFGAAQAGVTPSQISDESHGCAVFPPLLAPPPKFYYIFLNIIQENRIDDDFSSFLLAIDRPKQPNFNLEVDYTITPREYRAVAFNLRYIKQLHFWITTELTMDKVDLEHVYLTLHFKKD